MRERAGRLSVPYAATQTRMRRHALCDAGRDDRMTLLDEVRRLLAEDARRRVTDPKPLYATAGAVDAAVDFLRRAPDRLETAAERARAEWTPERFGEVFADLVDDARDTADDAVRRLQEERSKISSPAGLAASARDATEQVLDEARKAPGRLVVSVAESAGAVFETYDELAERGRVALAKLRGDAVPGETATSGRPGEQPPVFRRPVPPPGPGRPAPGGDIGHDAAEPPPGPPAPVNAVGTPRVFVAPDVSGTPGAVGPPEVVVPPDAVVPPEVVVPPAAIIEPAPVKRPAATTEPAPVKRPAPRRPPAGKRAVPPADPAPAATTPPPPGAARRSPATRTGLPPEPPEAGVAPPNAARRAARRTPPPGPPAG